MADVGKSQVRQVQNLGNSPAGATGYETGSRGDAYYGASSTPDRGNRVTKNINLQSPDITPAGSGQVTSGGGQYYVRITTKKDAEARKGRSTGLFGGKSGTGATQGDAGQLPIPTGGAGPIVVNYFLRAQDSACLPTVSYVYWVSTVVSTGSYPGVLPCGGPLINLTILTQWS